ncbi:hypothetical protein [Acidovorax sp.]|uniref:hypothetical protein n=1 Tax=Acidovorax sp. TaxID=1872122 RepID=UPI003918C0E1
MFRTTPHPVHPQLSLPALPWSPTRRRLLVWAAAATCGPVGVPVVYASAGSDGWPTTDASPAAQRIVRWAAATADNQGMPFAVIDKPAARIHVFSARAQWLGSAPVLLGAALGDRSAPDIGTRPLSRIRPEERTTPAGRFVTEPGHNLRGEDIVWIDYESAVSLHRVRSVHASERRLQRLATPGTRDKRVSYGCVNAPEAFYNQWIAPHFGKVAGVIYVLPDTEPFASVFAAASAY